MAVKEAAIEIAKATPPAGAGAMVLLGIQLSDWVLLGSALLIALQIMFLIRDKVYRPWKDKHDRSKRA